MEEILLPIGVERIRPGEVVQDAVNLLEVPGIAERHLVHAHRRLRRHRGDVGTHLGRQCLRLGLAQELEPVDQQVFVLAEGNGRPPARPAFRAGARAAIERGSEQSDGYVLRHIAKIINSDLSK